MSRRTDRNVGIIGLGIIGRRVADTLRHRNFHVFVWNRTPRPFPNFVGSPAEIAQLCDFVQIFVSDDDALLQMVQQIKPALKSHHVVMAHCTVAPATMRAAAEIVQRRGAQLLDAPFTGSKMAAEKGELVYYLAGDDAAFRRAKPVLQASSKEIIEIGEIGQATAIKLATNMITATTAQVTAEALALVHASGIPLEKFAEAMRGNASSSGTLAMKLPKMLEGDFEPHFSVKHMLKDVQIVSRLARAYGLELGATEAARDSLLSEVQQGRADNDYSSVVHRYFPEGAAPKTEEPPAAEEQGSLEGLDEPMEAVEPEQEPGVDPETPPEPIAEIADASADPEIAPEGEPAAEATPESGPAAEAQPEEEPTVPPTEAEPDQAPAEAEEPTVAPQPEEQPAAEPIAAKNGVEESRKEDENDDRRGFFGRLFGKGADY
jgi:3-hydroxyisobutyrate dehydrogenase-like beta-hydroxyacid dehydrogenase